MPRVVKRKMGSKTTLSDAFESKGKGVEKRIIKRQQKIKEMKIEQKILRLKMSLKEYKDKIEDFERLVLGKHTKLKTWKKKFTY
jgi:hypothetical protein